MGMFFLYCNFVYDSLYDCACHQYHLTCTVIYRLFALQDDIGTDILQVYNDKTVIDLPQNSHFLSTANASINATDLRKSISQWLAVTPWPAWNVSITKLTP